MAQKSNEKELCRNLFEDSDTFHWMEKIFQKKQNKACIFRQGVLIYPSVHVTQWNIRVWRSLVSRLNGVQEASSSNLDTRTKKPKSTYVGFGFLYSI